MMAIRLAKEVHELNRKLRSLSRDQAELVVSDIEGEERCVIVRLTPNDGYYKGGIFDFKIELPAEYPESMPAVTCLSYIYHPNIDPTTQQFSNVCLNILETDNWCEGFGLQGCIIGLLFLLHNPNFDDPINPIFEYRETADEYKDDIRRSMKGEKVGFLTGVLDEVFTLLIPKMRSIFAKDPNTAEKTSHGCDSDRMNEYVCKTEEQIDTPRTSEDTENMDDRNNEINHFCVENTTPIGKSDENIHDLPVSKHEVSHSFEGHIVPIIATTEYQRAASGNGSVDREHICESHINNMTATESSETQRVCKSNGTSGITAGRSNSTVHVTDASRTSDSIARAESVDYDDLLYSHFMDIN